MNSAAVLLPPYRRVTSFEHKVVLAFAAGSSCGAVCSALLFWFAGGFAEPLPRYVRLSLLGTAGILIVLTKFGPLGNRIRLPESKRQIPVEVLTGNAIMGAWRFGFELGTGLRTYVPSAAPYLVALTLLLGMLPLSHALLAGAGFGMGRAVPMLVQLTSMGRDGSTALLRRGEAGFGPRIASALVMAGMLYLVT